MKKVVAVALASAIVALALAASASPAQSARPRVTVIGDSVITPIAYTPEARALLGRNVDLHFLAVVCRRLVQASCWYQGERPATALEVIETNGSSLGPTVVVESGYNEYVQQYPDDLDAVMKELVANGVENVLWLTLREQRPDYATMNTAIRAAAAKWPQLVVVDWNAASQGRAWLGADGLHLNYDGTIGMSRLLRKFVLRYACGGSCTRAARTRDRA